jgi:hypothetical protein
MAKGAGDRVPRGNFEAERKLLLEIAAEIEKDDLVSVEPEPR